MNTTYTKSWTDKLGHNHTLTYDAQHHLKSDTSTWKDAKGQLNAQTLSHHGDRTEFSRSVQHQDGSYDCSTHSRDGHHDTSEDYTSHADGTSGIHHDDTWQGQPWERDEHFQHGQLTDCHDKIGRMQRDYRRLSGNTWDVRQRTFGRDGALQQEYQSTQDGSQRFAGHHFRYSPQGVDRQYWWQGVGRQEQWTPAAATNRLQQMMSGQGPASLSLTA